MDTSNDVLSNLQPTANDVQQFPYNQNSNYNSSNNIYQSTQQHQLPSQQPQQQQQQQSQHLHQNPQTSMNISQQQQSQPQTTITTTQPQNNVYPQVNITQNGHSQMVNHVSPIPDSQPRPVPKDIDKTQVLTILQFLKKHNLKGVEASLLTEVGPIITPDDLKSKILVFIFCKLFQRNFIVCFL